MSGSEIDKSENYGYDEEAPLAPPVSEVKDTDEDELSSGKAKLKAMADGTEKEIALSDLADEIRNWRN